MKLPLFLRFYLGVVLVFAISLVISIWVYEKITHKDYDQDFIEDTQYAANLILLKLDHNDASAINQQFLDKYGIHFRVNIVNEESQWPQFNEYTKVENSDDLELYEHRDQQSSFMISMPIKNGNGKLIIADLLEHPDEGFDLPQAFEEWGLIIIMNIGLALMIYWLSKSITRPVRNLVKVANAYGKAEFSKRADESVSSPLGELAESFNTMATRLQRLHNEQRVMTHAVAHEIRTPLMRMQMALGMVDKSNLDEKSKELLQNIDQYIEGLESLTSNVLSLARLSEQETDHKIDHIDINEVIRTRIKMLSLETDKIIDLNLDNSAQLNIKSTHFQLLLDNLVNNALFYSHSKIAISTKQTSENICLIIDDDGQGIPKSEREKIFTTFYRMDESRNKHSGGYGLGLALVASIVDRYNAVITVKDNSLGGSRFVVEFSKI